ncbi:MAG: hypothetical protein Q7K16_00305 [Candidatus Azambacteria bacterium]|nr:hypothetical protein [Candidatus Azambacteria bacterium]
MEQDKRDLIKSILIGLGAIGVVVVIGAIAPGLFEIFRKRKIFKNKYDRNGFNRRIVYLKSKKLIQINDNSDGTCAVELTEKGRRKILKYDIDTLKIKPMKKWDGRWRFVMFDIPDKHRKTSNALREKLKELGFFQFQKSIWVYPYPINDEITFISEIFSIRQFVKTGEIINLEDDSQLKSAFKLS